MRYEVAAHLQFLFLYSFLSFPCPCLPHPSHSLVFFMFPLPLFFIVQDGVKRAVTVDVSFVPPFLLPLSSCSVPQSPSLFSTHARTSTSCVSHFSLLLSPFVALAFPLRRNTDCVCRLGKLNLPVSVARRGMLQSSHTGNT